MVSKGQFSGLDWNSIARLHSQVMTGTHELTNNIGFFPSSPCIYVIRRNILLGAMLKV